MFTECRSTQPTCCQMLTEPSCLIILHTYRPAGSLGCGDSLLLYTLRSSGAQGLPLSLFYRHITPLERKLL